MRKNITDGLRLGELISGSGILDQEALDAALKLALASRLPLGRVLVSTNFVTSVQVDQIIHLQKLARSGACSVAEARRDAALAVRGQLRGAAEPEIQGEVEESLSFIEDESNYVLLSLLNRAGVLTASEAARYLEMSIREDVPCGRMLVLHRRISPSFRRFCLELLVGYRQGRISLDHAVVEACRVRDAGVFVAAHEFVDSATEIRLGQVMLKADVIDEIHLYDALEVSLSNNRRLGEVLVDSGIVTFIALKHCLEIFEAINKGKLAASVTADAIKRLYVAKVRASLRPESLTECSESSSDSLEVATERVRGRAETCDLPMMAVAAG